MTDSLIIATALAAGFFGSPHCLGMCGGIVSALSFALAKETATQRLFLQSFYHLGRLLSYSFLGLLVGLLGKGLLAPLANSKWPYVLTSLMMTPLRQRFMPINSIPRALIAGMLWGFLPCGLVYSALALALTTAHPITASGTMLAFGFGTLPMMLLAGSTAGALKQKLQQHGWRTANGLLIIAFGVWTLLQTVILTQHSAHQHQVSPASQTLLKP